jgi:DtxR family transcriptional regulator, manganese transport regulator
MPKKTKKNDLAKPSDRFQHTRGSHAKETAEDYVEAIAELNELNGICRGVDLARMFRVTPVTVSKTIARLQAEGLVDFVPYGPLSLTLSGSRMAAYSRARHEIVVRFLKAIGVSDMTAEIDAEGIEHHVSPETLAAIQKISETMLKTKRKG